MASSVKHLLGNGVQEIRFAFCQTGSSSASLRQFVASAYPQLKKLSPTFPVLVRESRGATPKITARYDFGVERSVDTSSLQQAADVEKGFLSLISYANNLPRSDESKDSKKIE